MRSLWKDILAAFFMGMVLPGLMLNYTVLAMGRNADKQDLPIVQPNETVCLVSEMPVLLRKEDGTVVQEDMDRYLVGVLLAEMPASFEKEALKAQAVAARTYARKAWETGGKHGDGSVCDRPGCCQAYLSREVFFEKGGTEDDVEKVAQAVSETSRECLIYDQELIEATYFSCSGGKTEDAVAVWGTDYPYLQSVDSPGEEKAAVYTDRVSFSPEEFQNLIGSDLDGTPDTWFGETSRTQGGGIQTIEIGGKNYSGTQLRSLLGLKSTAFDVQASENSIAFVTKGYGHRVGMSQYGAEAMAVSGCTYDQILLHYYPGTELVKIAL